MECCLRSGRGPAGFSLVEVIVALVILGVGILALARASSSLVGLMGASSVYTTVDALAGSRMEWLRGRACTGGSTTGTQSAGRMSATWTVEATDQHRDLIVVIDSPRKTGTHMDSVRSFVVCVDPV